MATTNWKETKLENPDFVCRECKSNNIEYRLVEDSDCHEDIEYHCKNCNRYWWVEGLDY